MKDNTIDTTALRLEPSTGYLPCIINKNAPEGWEKAFLSYITFEEYEMCLKHPEMIKDVYLKSLSNGLN